MAETLAAASPTGIDILRQYPSPCAVIPLTSVLIPAVLVEDRLRAVQDKYPAASSITVPTRGSQVVDAVRVPGIWYAEARSLTREAKTDFVWHSGTGEPRLLMPTTPWQTPLGSPDDIAARFGGKLADATEPYDLPHAPTKWTSVSRPGWHVSDLGVECQCGQPLLLVDWWHPDATRRAHSGFVACPVHGRIKKMNDDMRALGQARRELDAALERQPPSDGQWSVYVVEVVGLETPAVYVGQTSRTVEDRLDEHRTPGHPRQGRIFRTKRGGIVGSLVRIDLPTVPPLHSPNSPSRRRPGCSLC